MNIAVLEQKKTGGNETQLILLVEKVKEKRRYKTLVFEICMVS